MKQEDYEVEFYKGDGDKPFYARLKCPGNGEILAPSQGYKTAQGRAKTWSKLAQRLGCEIVKLDECPEDHCAVE